MWDPDSHSFTKLKMWHYKFESLKNMFTFHPVISLSEIVNNNGLCKDSDKKEYSLLESN